MNEILIKYDVKPSKIGYKSFILETVLDGYKYAILKQVEEEFTIPTEVEIIKYVLRLTNNEDLIPN